MSEENLNQVPGESDEAAEAQASAAAEGAGASSAGDSGESSESSVSAESGGAQGSGEAASLDGAESMDEELTDPLSEAMNTISSLEDQLARARADIYNVQQEYNSYVRRSKQEGVTRKDEGIASVIDNLLPVLDDIELARQHGDLEGPTGQIAEKIEQILTTNYQVERFGAEGDEFDPNIHEALMHQTSDDATSETVFALIQPGYRQGEKLLRAARVGVVSPE
ncbi:MAG: nucleotide exchange factor GrpE [Ancrocorticia sp.]|uniref:nucleotide exchange factor GrpE n=1 Tax=Ancrocorticia sp. TaxID=2593684 RepID=UPI003F900CAC